MPKLAWIDDKGDTLATASVPADAAPALAAFFGADTEAETARAYLDLTTTALRDQLQNSAAADGASAARTLFETVWPKDQLADHEIIDK